MSKANVLASLATDANELTSLADQISEIEGAIEQANTNFHAIQSLPEIPEIPPPVLSFRNKIINGNFAIWQRATSQTTTGWGSADRWRLNLVSSGTATLSQQSFDVGQTEVPGNPKYYVRAEPVTNSSSAENISIRQSIEGVETLAGQTATLSFWAKADSNKNIATEFFQLFGGGGSAQTSINPTTHSLTTSWQKFTTTFSVPSISGKTVGSNNWMGFAFFLSAGSDYDSRTNSLGNQSGTFDIAQVQLEEGEVATPFEHRPLTLELNLCQRYFLKAWASTYGNNDAGYSSTGVIYFPVEMRIQPTSTLLQIVQSGTRYKTDTTGFWSHGPPYNSILVWSIAQESGGNDGYQALCSFDAEL